MPKLIAIPQGCYAEITAETDGDIVGLYTSGMGPCCYVIVANTETGYMVLCHADQSTNLTDATTGIPAWIEKAKDLDGGYRCLIVNIGESFNESRGEAVVGSGHTYYEQVFNSVPEAVQQSITHHSTNDQDEFADTMLIKRKDVGIKEYRDKFAIEEDFPSSKGYTMEPLCLNTVDRAMFQGAFIRARIYAETLYHKLHSTEESLYIFFPPACVFDGVGNDYLSIEEIKSRYIVSQINYHVKVDWSRVERNAPSNDSTPAGSAHVSYSEPHHSDSDP